MIDKLPGPERSWYHLLSLHERADASSIGSMYSLYRIHWRINSLGYSASEYKMSKSIMSS